MQATESRAFNASERRRGTGATPRSPPKRGQPTTGRGLVSLRLAEEVDQEVFAKKGTELRDRLAAIKLQLDVLDHSRDETGEFVIPGAF